MKRKIFGLILIYFSVFVLIYGVVILNPFYTDWIVAKMEPTMVKILECYASYPEMLRDVPGNHLDFLAFLNSSAGIIYSDMNAFPFKSGILFVDYIPILSIFAKILKMIFMKGAGFVDFQYMGIVGAFNFILIGLFSFLIIKKITKCGYFNALLGSLFFVISPVLLERFPVHFALSSQWLVLAAFLPFLYYREFSEKKKYLILYWLVLGFLDAGTQVYFLPTTGFIVIAFMFYDYFMSGDKKTLWGYLPALGLGAFLVYLIAGGLGAQVSAETDLHWFSLYAFNLNSFYNPTISENFFYSTLLPFLNGRFLVKDVCNWEGFSYLGAGILLPLLPIVFYLLVNLPRKSFREKHSEFLSKYKIAIFVGAIFFVVTMIYACSYEIYFNQRLVVNIELPVFVQKILSIFRAPGRVIWADFYLIYFFVICFIIKNFKAFFVSLMLGVLIVVQAVDLSVFFRIYHGLYAHKMVYESPLKNEKWDNLKDSKKYLFISDIERLKPYHYRDVFYWALKNNFKINALINSRIPKDESLVLYDRMHEPTDDDLFVFLPCQKSMVGENSNLSNCYFLDGFIVCVKSDIPALRQYKIDVEK